MLKGGASGMSKCLACIFKGVGLKCLLGGPLGKGRAWCKKEMVVTAIRAIHLECH